MKVQNYQNIKYEFAFTAMPGKHLIKYLSKNEFKADKFKIMRFENLFSDAYSNITDHNTVIDIDKKNNLIFSHLVFPNVKYCSKDSRSKEKMSARSILNECSKTIATGESVLFQQIVKKEVERGKSFSELQKLIETNFSEPKKFLKILRIAERIKREMPDSKLSNHEFDCMRMKIMDEYLKSCIGKSIPEITFGLEQLV